MGLTKQTKSTELPETPERFSKRQLLTAKRFRDKRDLLHAVLAKEPDTAVFTVKEVENKMETYRKGTVN